MTAMITEGYTYNRLRAIQQAKKENNAAEHRDANAMKNDLPALAAWRRLNEDQKNNDGNGGA